MHSCIITIKPLQFPLRPINDSKPIGITICSIKNAQVIQTIPELTFSAGPDTVVAINPDHWFTNGLCAKILVTTSEASLQLSLHPHNLLEQGIRAEITSYQSPITKSYWTVFSPSTDLSKGIVIHFNLAEIIANLKKENEAFKNFQIKTFAETQQNLFTAWIKQRPPHERTFLALPNRERLIPQVNVDQYRQLERKINQKREAKFLHSN